MSLFFENLRSVNIERCKRWHGKKGVNDWSISEWLMALAGEAGEACNAGKKRLRLVKGNQQHGDVPANIEAATAAIMGELADVVIYADMCATRLGMSLGDAVREKFNQISEREGFPERL